MKKNVSKTAIAMLIVSIVGACSDKAYTSERAYLDSGSSIQTAVTGGALRGTEETLVGVIDGATGEESLMVRSNYSLVRELALAFLPQAGTQLSSGIVAYKLQKPSCGNNCGGGTTTNILIEGSEAVAISGSESGATSSSEVNIQGASCPNPINGVCPPPP